MSTTPKQLPDLTPELIEAAKACNTIKDSSDPRWQILRDYRDQWNPKRLVLDAAIHILTRALSAHRPIPMGGTKVGDLVRPCWDAAFNKEVAVNGSNAFRVVKLCPFRGVKCEGFSFWRSWVRVKGGAA